MCDQDNSHFTDISSSTKPQNSQEFKNLNEEFALVEQGLKFEQLLKEREEPIPYIPRTGRWWIGHWAKFFAVSPNTIKRRLDKINYSPMKFGDDLFIDAAELWKCLEGQDTES